MSIKHFIPQQVPEFILQKYPAFVEFVRAYYEWFEQEQIGLIEDVVDVDKTFDQFIQYFKSELDVSDVLYNNNNRLFLRRIKDLYKAKGSEASFDLFFKLVHKKPAEVFYPWDQTLKASDGKWIQEASIFIKFDVGGPADLVGKTVTIQTDYVSHEVFLDRYSQVEIEVDGVKQFSLDTFEFFIDRGWYNLLPINAAVVFQGLSRGNTVSTTSGVKVLTKGKGFRVGEIYEVRHEDGTGSLVKINAVGSNAEITKCQLIKFGINYDQPFTAVIIPAGISTNFIEYQATLEIKVGASAKYPGYYMNNDGLLNDAMYLQDSFYYQVYSYVVRVTEQLKNYKVLLKEIIHPTGLMLFGEYDISNSFAVSASIKESAVLVQTRLEDFLQAVDYFYKDFNKTLLINFSTTDTTSFATEKPLIYSAFAAADVVSNHPTKQAQTDLISTTDQIQLLDFNKRPLDANNVIDQIQFFEVSQALTTLLIKRDIIQFALDKYLEEPERFSTTEFGYCWSDDTYWDVSYCSNDTGVYNASGLIQNF